MGFIVIDQGARDPMADSAGLPCGATTGDRNTQIKPIQHRQGLKRLANHHPSRFATEELIEWLAIDLDGAGSRGQKDPRGGALASPGGIVHVRH
jgi:hypothetical protein